jgi:hypothetical protein
MLSVAIMSHSPQKRRWHEKGPSRSCGGAAAVAWAQEGVLAALTCMCCSNCRLALLQLQNTPHCRADSSSLRVPQRRTGDSDTAPMDDYLRQRNGTTTPQRGPPAFRGPVRMDDLKAECAQTVEIMRGNLEKVSEGGAAAWRSRVSTEQSLTVSPWPASAHSRTSVDQNLSADG